MCRRELCRTGIPVTGTGGFGLGEQTPSLNHEQAVGVHDDRFGRRVRVEHDDISGSAQREVIISKMTRSRSVARAHVEYRFDFVRERHLGGMRGDGRDFEEIGPSEWIERVPHAILTECHVDAGLQQFFYSGYSASPRLRVEASLQDEIVTGSVIIVMFASLTFRITVVA